ncbi:MAG TPA: class D sortase [Steroidobacteraceae bacterium]|nr:class D sortase [Steroidobacteraceae bacterium]
MTPARWIEAAAWGVGLALLSSYAALRVSAECDRRAGVEAFQELRQAAVAHVVAGRLPFPSGHVDQSLWSAARVRAFRRTSLKEAPAGILDIPALHLVVPIYSGTTPAELERGAGHIDGTAPLNSAGNAAIAGHRDGFFRSLRDIQLGQTLYLDTLGVTRRYRVTETRVVRPSDVSVLEPTAIPSITLVTCYPFYFVGPAPRRFIVRAEISPDRRHVARMHTAGLAQRQE